MKKKYGHMEFIVTKYDGLDGKTKVAYAEDGSDFTVIADQSGINFKGSMKEPVSTSKELEAFANLIGDMVKEHSLLKPKLSTSFSGH